MVGRATIEAGAASPAGYALLTGKPVVSEDLQAEASLSWRRSPGSSLELRFGI